MRFCLDQAEVESNVEGKPRLKARRRKHREERDGYRAFSSERRQFIIIFFSFFRPDVLSVLPPLMNMATRGGRHAARSTFVVYTSVRQVQSYACGFVVITLVTRGYIVCVVPASSGCTAAFLHTTLLLLQRTSQRWYYHIT